MIIPLIAAYGAVTAGTVAMGAAVAAGSLAGSVLAGMMIAGGALTAVGALTGNKSMSRFGMVLGLVGGIGALANGAFEASAEQVARQSAKESAQFAGAAEQAVSTTGTAAADASQLGAATGSGSQLGMDAINSNPAGAGGGFNSPMLSSTGPGAAGMTPGVAAGPVELTPPSFATQPGMLPTSPTVSPTVVPATAQAPAVPAGSLDVSGTGYNAQPQSRGMLSSITGGLKDGVAWATKNDANARLTQAGMMAASMVGKSIGDQEAIKTEIRLREDALQRSRDRLNASIAPVKMPIYKG